MSYSNISLKIRSLFFAILKPGIVAGLLPSIIVKSGFISAVTNTPLFHHYIGLLMFFAGVFIMINCIIRFTNEGQGTLSPADPTKRLVVSGLYKFSRNPMYVGVMLILFGEVVFTLSVYLLFYSVSIFILFNLFVVLKEEPRLKKDFGKEYEEYYKTVGRWL